jgi:hypothetical protein
MPNVTIFQCTNTLNSAPQLVLFPETIGADRVVITLGQIIYNRFPVRFAHDFAQCCIGRRRRRLHLGSPQLQLAFLHGIAAVDPRVSATKNVTKNQWRKRVRLTRCLWAREAESL